MKRRRKGDKGGGWYEAITVPVDDTRPTCSRCGTRTYILDQANGECLRCRLQERTRTADGAA